MKEVYQKPRPGRIIFRCDFCKRTNVRKETMERHEKICYYNPNRKCSICDGSGRLIEWHWEEGFRLSDDKCHPCEIADEIKNWLSQRESEG